MSRRRHRKRVSGRSARAASAAAGPAHATRQSRIPAIDALRGFPLLLMIAYHFLFDLNWFGVVRIDFDNDPFWLGYRALVVSWFLLLVGVSLVLADRAGLSRTHFWRRIAVVGGCALLVSVASYVTFPKTFISFGILHCIAVASILGWPLVRRPYIALPIGVGVIVAGLAIHLPLWG